MATTTAVPSNSTLAAKLAAKAEALATEPSKANRLNLDLDYDNERLNWSCNIDDFLNAVKPSSSGESEGLMVSLQGQFKFSIGGQEYKFDMAHARGGGAWVIVRMKA